MAFQLATNLDLGAQLPLDTRSVVANQTERNALVASGKAHVGLIVYVTGENKYYYYNTGNSWAEFSTVGGAPNLVYNTGDQTISGVKTFASRPTVDGTGVLLSGEAVRSNGTVNSMIKLTQAQYNALSPVDPTTFYVIVG